MSLDASYKQESPVSTVYRSDGKTVSGPSGIHGCNYYPRIGGMLIAMSIDIKYAFNTLPWSKIVKKQKLFRVDSRRFTFATRRVTAGTAQVIGEIRKQAIVSSPRQKPSTGSHIMLSGVRIEIRPQIKYSGLILDNRWSFRVHFESLRISPRINSLSFHKGGAFPARGC